MLGYKNGVQYATNTITATPITSNSSPVTIAQGTNPVSCPNGAGTVPGILDEVRIYNRALSPSEISLVYLDSRDYIGQVMTLGGYQESTRITGPKSETSF